MRRRTHTNQNVDQANPELPLLWLCLDSIHQPTKRSIAMTTAEFQHTQVMACLGMLWLYAEQSLIGLTSRV